jgi:nicotinamidase-related amidase
MMDRTALTSHIDPGSAALLIIDVQRALFARPTPIYAAAQLIGNINALIDVWHSAGGLIVYIQHSNDKMLVRDTPGWELHPDLSIVRPSELIHKRHGNAFEGTYLQDVLASRGIRQVVIAGLVTHGCIRATCLGARRLGYRTILVEDGHSNYSKGAGSLIEDWNWKLAGDGVELAATARIVLPD